MYATLHFTDGTSSDPIKVRESVETVNDIAYLDGIMHPNVADVEIEA